MFSFKGSLGTYINKDLMVIKRNGKVGIGTANPNSKLEIDNGGLTLNPDYKIDFSGTSSNDAYSIGLNSSGIGSVANLEFSA